MNYETKRINTNLSKTKNESHVNKYLTFNSRHRVGGKFEAKKSQVDQ